MQSLRKYLAEASYKSALKAQQDLIDLLSLDYDVEIGSEEIGYDGLKTCWLAISREGTARQIDVKWISNSTNRYTLVRHYETGGGKLILNSLEAVANELRNELED